MDKEQTIEVIERLPEFELIDVAVDSDNNWIKQPKHKSVVEKGTSESLTYVSTKRYKLVQFSEVFRPIAEGIESFQGEVAHYKGVCIMNVFPEISERNYKSDVHKSKALERLGEEIYNYALVAGV